MAIKSKGSSGTTYRDQGMMALLSSSHSDTACSHFDVVYGANNDNDNYKIYKLYLRDIDITDGYSCNMTFMSGSGTPNTSGAYGGGGYLGEQQSSNQSIVWNNADNVPLSMGAGSASSSGNYTGNWEVTIYANQSQPGAKMNYHFQGMHRNNENYTSGIWGGGTITQDGDYGVRITTNDTSNNRIVSYTYALYGLAGWTR